MRKIILFVCVLISFQVVSAQVHNSAGTLRGGKFSIEVAPVFFVDANSDVGLFLQGGIGLTRSMDLSLKFSLNNNDIYFGGDIEFALVSGTPALSLALGMHSYNKMGIDMALNLTIPIRKIVSIYGCLDFDVEFTGDDTYFPLWGVIGFEVMVRRHLGILMEMDIGITDPAPNMLGIGLCVYF